MNGVRRFLATGSNGSGDPPEDSTPPVPPQKSSWPPRPPSPSLPPSDPHIGISRTTTQPLSLRKDKQRSLQPTEEEIGHSVRQTGRSNNGDSARTKTQASSARPLRSGSPVTEPPYSPFTPSPNRLPSRKSANAQVLEWTQGPGLMNTRDELLVSLLASEAVVDSRDFEILAAEDVEELKKEYQVLSSKLEAVTKKLSLETKIRDAAVSLAQINASHKKVSKQSDEQLEAANRRVEVAQKEVWRVSERASDVHRRLMEHRAGVLSLSLRTLEKQMSTTNGTDTSVSGYNTPSLDSRRSPTTSISTSISTSSKPRFDGAHFFAGHADAQVPTTRRTPAMGDVAKLEEKLKAANDALEAANKQHDELSDELAHLRFEKQELEVTMGLDRQTFQNRLASQDAQFKQLLQDKSVWERDRTAMAEMERTLKQGAGELEGKERGRREFEQKEIELRELKTRHAAERESWERDRRSIQNTQVELDGGLVSLRDLIQKHNILLFSRDSSLQSLLSSVGTHLNGVAARLDAQAKEKEEWETIRRKFEEDIRVGLDKREAVARDVENARQEREDARREARAVEARLRDLEEALRSSPPPSRESPGDTGRVLAILQPLWTVLPSPEARAAKFASQRQFRTGTTPSSPGSPKPSPASLSELDVRSLKALYDNRSAFPTSPNLTPFSLDAFAARVQSLIADDRSLIERLLRFAQAHDLLKKNAERAQKLAQESNAALETYQKQVRTLEERNSTTAAKQAEWQDEIMKLQQTVDRITREKGELEARAAKLSETCRQLTEANNTLSAKTLSLAEEAASAPEMVRRQLDVQLSECKASLERAQEEIDMMRMSEQSQRIALLDELNTMQTENANLRAQVRALKK